MYLQKVVRLATLLLHRVPQNIFQIKYPPFYVSDKINVGLDESAYNDGRTITICPVYYAGMYKVHRTYRALGPPPAL